MPHETPSVHLCQRFTSLIWACLDADLHQSALFYAERYYVLDTTNHDARHLYSTALLCSGQAHSALYFVSTGGAAESRCTGCLEIKSRCCAALGRHRQAREALDASMRDASYTPSLSMGPRITKPFPEESVLHCRAGMMSAKGNLTESAVLSFRQALALNPMLWDAFDGLCSLGMVPEIDELFPPRPTPVKQTQPEEARPVPVATGAGFFTPDAGNGGNLFRAWKPDAGQLPPFQMGQVGPRDSIATADSSFYPDASFIQPMRASKSQPAALAAHPPAVRPLSSADEAGPVTKKLRSSVRQRTAPPSSNAADLNMNLKPSKSAGALLPRVDDRSKSSKARARPALTNANTFSSSGPAQTAATSRLHAAGAAIGKHSREQQPAAGPGTRRSTRLNSGTSSKPLATKHATVRDRRRAQTRARPPPGGGEASSPSPPPAPQSPHSNASPGPSSWTAAQERTAQEAYELELADYHIYELMRLFARATRAMALYDCRNCLEELEKLPTTHQRSAWVMAMVGKAHYELGEYAAAERAFEAVRNLEPYRVWDMEVYSTLLWHLQRNVKLAFLAQELVATDPRAPQAWIAVGNCFSLQRERVQALTCFRRAAQLDPNCAYAYTLSGHESIDEDLDRAINFFQSALRADPRHYNACTPQNAVLLGCVGMVTERAGDRDKALDLFNEAVRISPDNALVRYRRAKILILLRRYTAAAEDLEFLRDTSPEESNVIFQLAKVYRLQGDSVKSAQMLAVARDVSPKSVNKIRKLLETVKDSDVMDEG
ncbi:protein prenylyltransferase [Fomitopsis serialis]|uniref:protein prenylyltransferase n=1 Tax=Fomitopsis serialis TaxID=139415 RepID=UPI00200860D0|nr:protein prenylyltransferase [Neoantrodia serialis]KAH9934878.1 protein prenylyltransferase [Neoantrodia serialis]